MTDFKKILIIRTGAIGDVIHTTNVFRSIKEFYPDVEIHYLTSIDTKLLEFDKCITKIWSIKDKQLKIFSKYMKEYAELLSAENFDAAINLQPSLKLKTLVKLAGIKKQFNYKKNSKHHAVMNYWETAKKAFPDIRLHSDLKMYLSDEVSEKMKQELSQYKKPLIVINAGHVFAKRQGRTYPIEKWVDLGNKIQEKYAGTILITGVKEDFKILKPLEKIPNTVSYVDKLSLEENCALIKNSDMLISGDSGPLHIAAALGIKTVGLFGSMPTSRFGPYGKNCSVVLSSMKCAPCNHVKCKYLIGSKDLYAPCMKIIETDDIMIEIDKLFDSGHIQGEKL